MHNAACLCHLGHMLQAFKLRMFVIQYAVVQAAHASLAYHCCPEALAGLYVQASAMHLQVFVIAQRHCVCWHQTQ